MGYRELRRDIPVEEFDYPVLITYLDEYSNKREKITHLIKNEKIIRVKKGLYVFGPDFRKGLICKETLANQIYGPSYISLEYALSLYGMIPERVEVLTSVTTGTSKNFTSPIGAFSYRHLQLTRYKVGIILRKFDDYHSALIASPEKALIDQIYFSKGLSGQSNLQHYLLDDLRIDEESLKSLSLTHLNEIADIFSNARITRAVNFIKEFQSHG
jgi:predicted transcriptional regulator of viral defense system